MKPLVNRLKLMINMPKPDPRQSHFRDQQQCGALLRPTANSSTACFRDQQQYGFRDQQQCGFRDQQQCGFFETNSSAAFSRSTAMWLFRDHSKRWRGWNFFVGDEVSVRVAAFPLSPSKILFFGSFLIR
jgi:hypothetical protein